MKWWVNTKGRIEKFLEGILTDLEYWRQWVGLLLHYIEVDASSRHRLTQKWYMIPYYSALFRVVKPKLELYQCSQPIHLAISPELEEQLAALKSFGFHLQEYRADQTDQS